MADRVEELVPGATSASLDELSLRCYAWLDDLLADSHVARTPASTSLSSTAASDVDVASGSEGAP